MRWTQELAKVMARLLGKEPDLQLEIIANSYEELLELDLGLLDQLLPEALLPYLLEEKQYNEGQLEFLAEMLYQHGRLLMESTQFSTGRRRLQYALLIFEFLDARQDVFSFERQGRMQDIRQAIDKK